MQDVWVGGSSHLVQLLKSHSQHTFRSCRRIVHVVEAKRQFRAASIFFHRKCEGDVFTDIIVCIIEFIFCIDRNGPE